jgi:hypothetical protein
METNEIWENTEQRLKQLIIDPKGYLNDVGEDEEDDPINVFLSNEVLEIKREQSYGSKGWTTSFYTFVIGIGGPHVEFDTNYHINVYWGGEKSEGVTYDEEVRAVIGMVDDYMREVYDEQ